MSRFNQLIGQTQAVYHEAALRLGLSDSVQDMLYVLLEQGGDCPLQTLCQRCALPKQTINSALRKLEAQGTVSLRPHGRGKRVSLTPAGQALAERTVGRLIAAENAILAAWPEEDTARYLALTEAFLTALRKNVRNFDPGAGQSPDTSTGGPA